MRQIRVTLTDAQYDFAKSKGRLWLREVVEREMWASTASLDTLEWLKERAQKKPWWRFGK